jgi:glyoxylase-like metal-dependent hydrolase (beta-lactamase superfamily II)
MQQIERGIYYEDGYLGVTLGGLVYSHGTIMIDAPLRADEARTWRSALLNQRGGSNRLLINLDAHPDRTLGARSMECTIVAHQKAALVFRNRPTIFKGQNAETGSIWENYTDAIGVRWANPDITFSDRMSLYWGGPEVVLEHHPGPSIGAIWVLIPEAKVVFIGDAVVMEQPPFLMNADLTAWLETLNLLKNSYKDYLIVSSRGGPVPNEAVRAQIKYLEKVNKGFERLANKNALPEATESLVASLLSDFSITSPELKEKYTQRLRYGLLQYYLRSYRSEGILEELEDESD